MPSTPDPASWRPQPSPRPDPLIGVDLPGAGAHPQAWRREDSRAEELFGPRYWADLAGRLDAAGADLAFLPDRFGVASGPGTVRGRLEALGTAARLSTTTRRIGLVPTQTTTHTEPFHVAKAVQSLDHTTRGRAGWQVDVSADPAGYRLFGRKEVQDPADLWDEAAEAIEVASRLWDSWEDDAEIRDVATGRFVDREKLHYIDFVGRHFSVKGPSITPRSPQGRPVVVIAVTDQASRAVAVRTADIIRVAADAVDAAEALAGELRREAGDRELRILLDVDVHVAADEATAIRELAQLEEWAGEPYRGRTLLRVGSAASLVGLITDVGARPPLDGVVLRPLALAGGVTVLTQHVLPALRPPELARDDTTLRELLGLSRPANRYAA